MVFAVGFLSLATFSSYLLTKNHIRKMCVAANEPICSMKMPNDPAMSPIAEKSKAAVICHGHIHNDAIVNAVSGYAVLQGRTAGMKYNTARDANTADEAMAMFLVSRSEMLKNAIMIPLKLVLFEIFYVSVDLMQLSRNVDALRAV